MLNGRTIYGGISQYFSDVYRILTILTLKGNNYLLVLINH